MGGITYDRTDVAVVVVADASVSGDIFSISETHHTFKFYMQYVGIVDRSTAASALGRTMIME